LLEVAVDRRSWFGLMSMVMFEVGAAVLGACVGSFLNVVIHRLPQEDEAKRSLGGRSHCPHCGAQIAWHDNIPVLGWMLLRGKARCCKQRISVRYPLVELITALLFYLAAHVHRFGEPVFDSGLDWTNTAAVAFDAAFLAFLVASTFIDWDHRILPDALNYPFSVLGVTVVPFVAHTQVQGYAGTISEELTPAMNSWLASVLGLAAGYGLTWTIRTVAQFVFRKEAMGFGDVKFMAAIGAFLGWQGALLTFFLGCLTGAVGGLLHRMITRDTYVPFGPFLAAGAVLTLFAQQPILDFLFHTWPEWQRSSPTAIWYLSGSALLCIVLLVIVVRRGRGHSST
jgi:leader peptidase (prepilin peptidase)/N-methyltransferase